MLKSLIVLKNTAGSAWAFWDFPNLAVTDNMKFNRSFLLIFSLFVCVHGFQLHVLRRSRSKYFASTENNEGVTEEVQVISSSLIERYTKQIEELTASIAATKDERKLEEIELDKLDAEYGGEITRIKKEFARMKERSIEESLDISNKAKVRTVMKDIFTFS